MFWTDTVEDGDRKRRRQAEFLIHQFCPCEIVTNLGVMNSTVASEVSNALEEVHAAVAVTVERAWYY